MRTDPTRHRPADEPPRRQGRPPRIDRHDIVDTAIGIGLDRFSIADVAGALGVSVSALYRHVDSRERIYSLGCDAVWQRLDRSAPLESSWRSYVGTICERAVVLAVAHPGLPAYVTYGPYETGTISIFDELIAGVTHRAPALTPGRAFVVVSRSLHAALGYLFGRPEIVEVNRRAIQWNVDALLDGMAARIDAGDLPPESDWAALRDAVAIPPA